MSSQATDLAVYAKSSSSVVSRVVAALSKKASIAPVRRAQTAAARLNALLTPYDHVTSQLTKFQQLRAGAMPHQRGVHPTCGAMFYRDRFYLVKHYMDIFANGHLRPIDSDCFSLYNLLSISVVDLS